MLLFCAAAFLMEIAFGSVFFALPLLALGMGATPFQLGLLGSLTLVFYVPLVFLVGRHTDRRAPRPLLLLAIAGLFLIAAGLALARGVYALCAVSALIGCALALFWPPLMMAVKRSRESSAVGRTVGLFSISWSVGSILAPMISGFLFEVNRLAPLVLAMAALAVCAAVVARFPASAQPAPADGPAERFTLDPPHRISFLGNFTCASIHSTLRNLFPQVAVTLGIGPSLLGLLFMLTDLFRTGMFFLCSCHRTWYRRRKTLVALGLLFLTPLVVFIFSGSTALFAAAFACLGLSGGIFYALSLYDAFDRTIGSGTAVGLLESLGSFGYISGSLAGGLAARITGSIRAPYVFAVTLAAVTGGAQAYIARRGRTAAPDPAGPTDTRAVQ